MIATVAPDRLVARPVPPRAVRAIRSTDAEVAPSVPEDETGTVATATRSPDGAVDTDHGATRRAIGPAAGQDAGHDAGHDAGPAAGHDAGPGATRRGLDRIRLHPWTRGDAPHRSRRQDRCSTERTP